MVKKIVPRYAVLPLLICLIIHFLTYYGSRLINSLIYGSISQYVDLTTKFDQMIPLSPVWVYIYVLSYVFWVVCYVVAARDSNRHLGKIVVSDLICKILCFIIFIAMPTTFVRPECVGNEIGSWLLRIVYSADLPDNLFPSMHCASSWLSFRFMQRSEKMPKWSKVASFIMALLVFASVVFTKQHIVLDILAGVVVAEIGVQIGFNTKLYKKFKWFDIAENSKEKI